MSDNRLLCRNGTWYYRRVVPKHLAATIGRPIIQHSLKTKDKNHAKKLREIEDVKWSAIFEAAESEALLKNGKAGTLRLSDDELITLVRSYVTKADRTFHDREINDSPSGADRNEALIETEIGRSILRNPDDIRADQWIGAVEDKLLKQAGASADVITPDTQLRLYDLTRRGLLELQRRKLARYQDRFDRPFFDGLFDPARPDPVSFRALAEQYLAQATEEAEANGMSPKWIDKVRARVTLIRELIGDETPVAAIDYDRCLTARSMLARIPSNRTKIYGDLPLEQAIANAKIDGRALLAPVTQAGYLDTLRDILHLATLKRLLPHNPAATLRPLKRDDMKAEEKRLPFTPEQLKAFFASDFYASCSPNAAMPYAKKDRDWRFWMPLLSLFMGMRPNEICQMLPSDVKCTGKGTWYVDVVASSDDDEAAAPGSTAKTVKTSASRRKIPVHPKLIEFGFIAFAERQQKANEARLLGNLKPDKYGNLATYALRRFRESFLKEAITVEPRQSFYSFRHCFRDALRRSEAGPDALKALGGWSQGKTTSDYYGDNADPDLHTDAMAKISFPGLKLDHLRPTKADHASA